MNQTAKNKEMLPSEDNCQPKFLDTQYLEGWRVLGDAPPQLTEYYELRV